MTLLAGLALLTLSLTARASDRLPEAVLPEIYEVNLEVDPAREVFSGWVRIEAVVARKTDEIVLHAVNLDMKGVLVDGVVLPADKLSADTTSQTLTLRLPRPLPPGRTTLEFRYSAPYDQHMAGLYLSTAKHEGQEERYAFTQFEATDARRMLPCFDEPAFKAKFRLTVTAPAHLTVLSNMPAAKSTRDGASQTVAFEETPRMSTYLLALAVARLTSKSARVGDTQVNVWTMPRDIGQADFALEAATQALTRLNAYFNLPYGLPKLDLVAVPDFAAGAMENWGAIFFRDGAVLFDPKLTSARGRRRVAGTVTHEVVHQWFGNLVTMKWWNDVWLNEAFATWLATKLVDQWHPEWMSWLTYEQGTLGAMDVDALRATRPVSSKVATTAEIDAQFDRLSYEKGGSVLRMFENFLGEERFRRALGRYIVKYQYQNTEAVDLWRELEAASGEPMVDIATNWIVLPGYPLVGVASASPDNRTLRISQRRFSAHGASQDPALWNIPMVLKYRDQAGVHLRRITLRERETTLILPAQGRVDWVYPNQAQAGFYRCALDAGLLKSLQGSVPESLDPLERIGVLSDLWAQARSGQAPLSASLDFMTALRSDGSRATLQSIGGYLSALDDRLISGDDRPRLAAFAASLLAPHWSRLGWTPSPGEDDEARLARASVLINLGRVSAPPDLVKGARDRLDPYFRDPSSLDPALVYAVLSLNAKSGDAARFERYKEALKNSRTPEEKDNLLWALADFSAPELNDAVLSYALTPEVRGQDVWKPINGLLARPFAQDRAWRYLEDHWAAVSDKAGGFMGARRIVRALGGLSSDEARERVSRFFERPENHPEEVRRELDQSLEEIELTSSFKKAQAPDLSAWLRTRY